MFISHNSTHFLPFKTNDQTQLKKSTVTIKKEWIEYRLSNMEKDIFLRKKTCRRIMFAAWLSFCIVIKESNCLGS
jgi:hypothetical protein